MSELRKSTGRSFQWCHWYHIPPERGLFPASMTDVPLIHVHRRSDEPYSVMTTNIKSKLMKPVMYLGRDGSFKSVKDISTITRVKKCVRAKVCVDSLQILDKHVVNCTQNVSSPVGRPSTACNWRGWWLCYISTHTNTWLYTVTPDKG